MHIDTLKEIEGKLFIIKSLNPDKPADIMKKISLITEMYALMPQAQREAEEQRNKILIQLEAA